MLTAGWQLLHVILCPQSMAIRNLKGHPVSLRIWCRIIYTFLFSLSDVAVVHETIEHIFVADKHLAQGRRRIVGSILN